MFLRVLRIELIPVQKNQQNFRAFNWNLNFDFFFLQFAFTLTNEIIAANNKILTKRSSNCSKTNCQMVFPGGYKRRVHIKYLIRYRHNLLHFLSFWYRMVTLCCTIRSQQIFQCQRTLKRNAFIRFSGKSKWTKVLVMLFNISHCLFSIRICFTSCVNLVLNKSSWIECFRNDYKICSLKKYNGFNWVLHSNHVKGYDGWKRVYLIK